MGFELVSTAFTEGQPIPPRHTGDGADVSPPLSWGDPPDGTAAFVMISDDPDAPVGTWVHWVLYDISPDVRQLPEGVPMDDTVLGSARQGRTDFGTVGYGGPAPPPGRPHRYFFKLYAVDAETALSPGATKQQVLQAIEGHVLAQAQLMGTYQR